MEKTSQFALSAFIGAVAGMILAAYAQSSLDARNVQAGAMIFDGKLYRITPEERP